MEKFALVVDDSKTMRDIVSHALQSVGFEVLCAVNGVNALEVAQGKDFTVITTDFNMPNMNGVELTKSLRANPRYSKTPILLISSEQDQLIKEDARNAGASGWVRKPFEASILISAVNKICGLAE